MRLSLRISVSLLLLALPSARAQTADDFFNSGAQSYISNNIPQALKSVDAGLKQYPEDVKLKKLYELLKQQSQQQQQQQNQQNQQNQSNQQESKNNQSQQSQQNQNSNSQQSQQQSQQNSQPNQQQNQQAQNQSNQQNQQSQKQQPAQTSSSRSEGKSGAKNEKQAANTEEMMTPEEAKQLLDAQKGDEQVLQLKPKGFPQNSERPFKDW
jgi:Ca-activated chloride channel homolog